MEVVRQEVEEFRISNVASEILLQAEERDRWAIAGVASMRDEEPRIRILPGGRLTAAYTMAEMGELAYDSEIAFKTTPTTGDVEALDVAVLERLKEASRSELDCQVCYALFLDPLTTTCGHTFCRKCLHRVLDHSNLCPICRRLLAIPPTSIAEQAPSNSILTKLIGGLCPEALAARSEAAILEDQSGLGDLDTPLFICALSFPTMPTFLHIFEPRYRLMIRRAMESPSRTFGMLPYNSTQEPQGDLGAVNFYQYGTLLQIINMELMPDGRSLIETVGVSRFRVLRHGSLDGYTVGQTERIDDISLADEEALESSETTTLSRNLAAPNQTGAASHHITPRSLADLNSMPTQQLMDISINFVKKMQDQSASWLHSRVFQTFGPLPENDPALFPWWFASVLPLVEVEKYRLLGTTSVRERLKICVGWITRIEAQRWYANLSSSPSPCKPTFD
ncbi:PUA protein [Coleophoma crateriformis]|uniref:PUA protein n=1 Tax=Coleophoma crateriformis TaxID=565419 RepID=A0A3D8R7P5_9HELO|nr:PUA protein [Coleophoma crateriformis]